MEIAGLAAVVTGAASGLGAATAEGLAAAGMRVALLDRNAEGAAAVAARIGALGLGCDVTDEASVVAALDAAEAAHGPARVLVTCAGVADPGRAVGRNGPLALAAFSKVIGINLIGTFNVVRLAAARMVSLDPLPTGERGAMVMTASIAAYDGQIGQPAYAASKGGVAAMTLPLARELAPQGVRVMSIAPGIFKTPMLAGLPEEVQASLGAAVPFPSRLGDPAEFGLLVRQILANPMLNGEVIRLDGALRMPPK
ncbi:MAG: SDR family NAD(P)-dependent oxidoreductase [Alphaproteobacteria bacterium]|nr:SDR family NAD(P)-dependent oxidoreductase [Alphaproteobacteria bacterium]TAD87972.1 MAG: SDR family NAD(P)-dependent oxidoreductase [Alphaproteobacteria bacterium]